MHFYRTGNVESAATAHDLSDSGGEEEFAAAEERVTFPTLVTRADFEDSEDIAEGEGRNSDLHIVEYPDLSHF